MTILTLYIMFEAIDARATIAVPQSLELLVNGIGELDVHNIIFNSPV